MSEHETAQPDVRNEIGGFVYGPVVQARDISSLHVHASGQVTLPVPRQLPPAPAGFVNREVEVSSIDDSVARQRSDGATPVVVVTGAHGVGKTAIGRRWAHQNTDWFRDGQLYADFSQPGYRDRPGVGDVLGGFLRACGLPEEAIPVSLPDRVALFRSCTAGKRVLVLLDEVEFAAQVQPLIPNTPEACVVVTSRAPLEELAQDGVRSLRLKPLDDSSARALLVKMIGEPRVAAERDAVTGLVSICGGLPVALRICGARLATQEERPLRWLLDELQDEAERLQKLRAGSRPSLRVVFDDAYRALEPGAATLYRRLGLFPGWSFSAPAAAAAGALELPTAVSLLGQLASARLIEEEDGRFLFHDLLRLHARGLAEKDEPEAVQDAVVRRSVAFFLAAAQQMDRAIVPRRLRLAPAPPAEGTLAFGSPAEALAWFEAERANLLRVLRSAVEREMYGEAWQLGEALFIAYHNHKHYEEAREVYELALTGAVQCGERDAEARLRGLLARAHTDLGDYERAADELAVARRLAEDSEHPTLAASIEEWWGVLEIARGAYKAAVTDLERARELFEQIGNDRGVALQEYHLGRAHTAMGEHRRAVKALARASTLVDHENDGLTAGRILLRLGEAYQALGDAGLAGEVLRQALEVMERNDAPFYEAQARESLAPLELSQGNREMAGEHLRRALSIYAAIGSPRIIEVSAALDAVSGRSEG
jgi:tetratricopeptide (TPR) repeat protein